MKPGLLGRLQELEKAVAVQRSNLTTVIMVNGQAIGKTVVPTEFPMTFVVDAGNGFIHESLRKVMTSKAT